MDALVDALIRFAQEMLGKHGEFSPLRQPLRARDRWRWLADTRLRSDRHHRRLSTCSIRDLLIEHTVVRSELRAFASTFDLPERDNNDAIQVSLEHASAEPVNVFLPYQRQRLRGVKYGELFATPGKRRIFS